MKKLEKLKTDRTAVAANLEREKAGEARENILRVLGRTLWGLDQQIEWAEAGKKLQCTDCKACDGATGRKGSIAIIVHGALAKRFAVA